MIHEFVEYIPDDLKDGVIYVSTKFGTVVHKCCCGCGNEVVTPLSPTDWQVTFDGESISLYPSIGNWSLDCKSHYWIKNNKVKWSYQWSEDEINAGRYYDSLEKKKYYNNKKSAHNKGSKAMAEESKNDNPVRKNNFWLTLKKWRS